MAIENYSGYTSGGADYGDVVSIGSNVISVSGAVKDDRYWLYKDFGADHFNGDFEHKVAIKFSKNGDTACQVSPWVMTNTWGAADNGHLYAILNQTSGRQTLAVYLRGALLSTYLWVAEGYNTATKTDYWGTALSESTWYYLTIERDTNEGDYGTLYLYIYSDSSRTTLLSTESVALSADLDYRYLHALNQTSDTGRTASYNADVAGLDLQEAGATTVTGALGVDAPAVDGDVTIGWKSTGALDVPAPTVSGTAKIGWNVTGSLTVPAPSVDANAAVKMVWNVTGALNVPAPGVDGAAIIGWMVSGALGVPAPSVSGALTYGIAQVAASLIDAYLRDTVSIVTPAASDKFGDPGGDDTVASANARVNWKTRLVRNFAGEEVVAAGSVLLKSRPAHTAQIRIDGIDHSILAIAEKKHFSVSHYEVAIA